MTAKNIALQKEIVKLLKTLTGSFNSLSERLDDIEDVLMKNPATAADVGTRMAKRARERAAKDQGSGGSPGPQ